MSHRNTNIDSTQVKEPRSRTYLRSLGAIAICWYVMNFAAFVLVSMGPSKVMSARYSAAQIDYLASLPLWSMMLSGLCIGFGIVASVALYLRRQEAYPAFMLCLLLAIGHFIDVWGRGGLEIMGAGDAAAALLLMVFSMMLFWATYDARTNHQLD